MIVPVTPAGLTELRARARSARRSYDFYRAKAHALRLTSPARMRELERRCARAETTLRFAQAKAQHLHTH